ncbi:MAG: [protein-PII] uridylyltransferase [Acidimicrobiales bacterium]
MVVDQAALLSDDTSTGAAWSMAHTALVDHWLSGLFDEAAGADAAGVALVAVGGYGRSELCPQSDIQLMVVHGGRADIGAVADQVWYPVWDKGLRLGHTVCTVRESLDSATDSLDTATALLSARHVAGDPTLTGRLADGALGQWQKQSKRFLAELGTRVDLRHQTAGEVAFRLEPDLKEGRGGLRDVHALQWAESAQRIMLEHDQASLAAAYAVLLDVRVELQRLTGRPGNVLALQDQESIARALGLGSDEELMRAVARAGRTIAWTSDDTWRRIRSSLRGPAGRANGRARELAGGLQLRDGEIHLSGTGQPADTTLALRAAAAAAEQQSVIDRHSLEQLAAGTDPMPDPWPAEARKLFLELLLRGPSAVAVVEALDQRGVWTRILPEWAAVRARPQRNPYHRYTVDRHLLETVAAAARLAPRTDRPDLLVLAALLHDLGKGCEGDPCATGVDLAQRIGTRMGLTPDDTATVTWLVERHLLLPEVAGRRDLDDSTTIERVASVVGSSDRLALLAALTEADALATGPAAWGPGKSRLVAKLVERVALVLSGRTAASIVVPQFPSPAQLERLAAPGRHIDASDDVLTIVTDDRLGVFSRVAGVLALHGLDVIAASAYSSDDGRALSEFRVADPVRGEIPWPLVLADIELGLDGRLAIPARLAERARAYGRVKRSVAPRTAIKVTFDDDASADATVLDVQAPDAMGALYRITRVFGDLDIDIRSARVQTMGNSVVDSFYVRDRNGRRISDPVVRAEIARALIHSLSD